MNATGAGALAWRLHLLNWLAIAICAATFFLCLVLTDFSILPQSLARPLGLALAYLAIARIFVRIRQRDSFGHYAFGSMAQIALVASLMAPLSYVAASIGMPMQDGSLARLDNMLGLNWAGYFHLLYDRPALIAYAHLEYGMIIWPSVVAPFVLAANGEFVRLQQFTFACVVTLAFTAAISAVVPALGTYQQYGIGYDPSVLLPTGYLEQLRVLPQVRSGALRMLEIDKMVGIVTFPSFHAAAAILFIWAYWPVWWMRPLVLITNGLMLLATPIFGGHYFIDVFAGIAVAVIAIAVSERAAHRLARPALPAGGFADAANLA
jgi:hypothetical protein